MIAKRKFDIRLSQRDFNMLERRARRCKISKSEYMRRLLNRCVPREAPPLDYYGMMNELKAIREDLDVLAQMATATGFIDAKAIDVQLRELRKTSEKIGLAVAGEYDEDD
ncbi:plasmid mobilization protein [Acutalibacter muris]|uniref:plasmid mobilization protein n=1 Tax=Acutalibacter muris TaxID=1796620 RepID=UPI0026F4043E|nr:hypothetical protein [Acutalibacter muris]